MTQKLREGDIVLVWGHRIGILMEAGLTSHEGQLWWIDLWLDHKWLKRGAVYDSDCVVIGHLREIE